MKIAYSSELVDKQKMTMKMVLPTGSKLVQTGSGEWFGNINSLKHFEYNSNPKVAADRRWSNHRIAPNLSLKS